METESPTKEGVDGVERLKQRQNLEYQAIDGIIRQLVCPITQALPLDPVNAMDGHCYERSAIVKHISLRRTSPMTNAPMGSTLTPARNILSMVHHLNDSGVEHALLAEWASALAEAKSSPAVATAKPGLIFYGSGPILRFENRICKLLVHSESGETRMATCEWLDVNPLKGKLFSSMNHACESLLTLMRGPSRRWTVNVWTNLTVSPGGHTLMKYRNMYGDFRGMLQDISLILAE